MVRVASEGWPCLGELVFVGESPTRWLSVRASFVQKKKTADNEQHCHDFVFADFFFWLHRWKPSWRPYWSVLKGFKRDDIPSCVALRSSRPLESYIPRYRYLCLLRVTLPVIFQARPQMIAGIAQQNRRILHHM